MNCDEIILAGYVDADTNYHDSDILMLLII